MTARGGIPKFDAGSFISFDRNHRFLLALITVSFLVLLAFRINGFSLPFWRYYLDGSPMSEVLLGEAQAIRSDDYIAMLPTALSQIYHRPSYPEINQLIGSSLDMELVLAPVKTWVGLFRAGTWGFFIGADVGLAWLWWTRVFGTLYCCFLLFMMLSKNAFWLSLAGALIFLFSPFVQFWSLNQQDICAYGVLSFISFFQMAVAQSTRKVIIWGALLSWSLICFTLTFYPPSQLSLFYCLLFLALGFAWEQRSKLAESRRASLKLTAGVAAAAVAATTLCFFFSDNAETLALIQNTDYPGRRVATGGDYPFWRFFSNNFFLYVGEKNQTSVGGNVCETGSFIYLFPFIFLSVLWDGLFKRQPPRAVIWICLLYIAAGMFYLVHGIPASLSKATLLSYMPGYRGKLGLGLANAALLIAYVSSLREHSPSWPKTTFMLACTFCGSLWLCAVIARVYTDLPASNVLYGVIFNSFASAFLLQRHAAKAVMAGLVLILPLTTGGFNPLVKGGVEYFHTNPLCRKIIEIDKANNGESRWASFGSRTLSDFFRIIGVESISGVHLYPQKAIWEKLDAEGKFRTVYNRFGHVYFGPINSDEVVISNPVFDVVYVEINPASDLLQKLRITHILVQASNPSIYDSNPGLKKLFSAGDKHIYQLIGNSNGRS